MIYFAQIGRDGPIKIGRAEDVKKRLRSLQVGMPWSLHLLLVLDQDDHRIYHDFSASRMRGEWFYPTQELLAFIGKQGKLSRPDADTWMTSRMRRGTNPVFMRPIMDYCLIEAKPW